MTALERHDPVPVRFTGPSLRVLREQMAPDASDEDLAYFARVCNRLQLSPFADQIVLVGRRDRRVGRVVHRHQITVTGRRTLAVRSGELEGIAGPEWCGPRVDGQLVWREVWDDDSAPPYCARVLVYRRKWKVPANGTAKWSEFAQYNSDGKLAQLWNQMPSLMLGKCAESLALRRAFPDVITADTVDGFDSETVDVAVEAAALGAVQDLDVDVAADVDVEYAPAATAGAGEVRLPGRHQAMVRPGDWTPTNPDQAEAHTALANWNVKRRLEFLGRHRIEHFDEDWPPAAVAEVLAGPPDIRDTVPETGPASE